MALPESSLSRACRSIADHLRSEFVAAGSPVQVRIGTPWAAAPAQSEPEHCLNLFFHRLEPRGFAPDTLPGEPWWLRLHCVITAFAVEEDRVSAGENDLRLIGELVRIFHEKPVLDAVDVGGETMAAQFVFEPLTPEDINRLWSTQKDVAYRLSVAYEIALTPIVPRRRAVEAPRAGMITTQVSVGGAPDVIRTTAPILPPVNHGREDWAPRIAFATPNGPEQTLALALGSRALRDAQLPVVIAGAVGTPMTLVWDVWDAQKGWRPGGTPQAAQAMVEQLPSGAVPDAATTKVKLPFTETTGQAALCAVRDYRRAHDGAALQVRSNPLLVTVFGGTP
jgi:hypothetical protein